MPAGTKLNICPQCGEKAELHLCPCEKMVCDSCRLGKLHDLCWMAWKPKPFKRCRKRKGRPNGYTSVDAKHRTKQKQEADLIAFMRSAERMDGKLARRRDLDLSRV